MRRVRGAVLRLALRRPVALAVGALLLAPALLVMIGDYRWESWVSDGLALVLGATGASLVLVGIGGRRPDWIDEE